MDGLDYYSSRPINNFYEKKPPGKITAWIEKQKCHCGQPLSKPLHPDGKIRFRAQVYVCTNGHEIPKAIYDKAKVMHIDYLCPFCGKTGQTSTSAAWNLYGFGRGVIFTCSHCQKNLPITKKLKDPTPDFTLKKPFEFI